MANSFIQYGKDGLSGYDSKGQRRIFLDPVNLLLSFFDTTGIPRVEMGNLALRGTSAAGWGFRVNDANGNPIYDSTGLIQHTTLLGGSPLTDPNARTIVATTWAQVPSSLSITFTLARQSTIRVEAQMTMVATGGTGFDLQLAVDSTTVPDPASSRIVNDATQTVHPGSLFLLKTLPAGPHTVYILGESAIGANPGGIGFTWLAAYLLGG